MIHVEDRGPWSEPLRWAVIHERPGRRPEMIAAFRRENEARAYLMARGRAERRLAS